MDENKKSIILHFLTEFLLFSIGIGILIILLWINQFKWSLSILSLWVFFLNAVLFSYWIWKSKVKIWEKSIVGIYFFLIEFIIINSYTVSW